LKRLGLAEEIAHAVRFIFENDFFTGRCLDVDGGLRL
jgi:3-oxoacyl-[acyl-carrier protein] reductase